MVKILHGVALVIGISDYEFLSKQEHAINDSVAMKGSLEECGYRVIYLENPTTTQIQRGVEQFIQLLYKNKYREMLIFYSGHCILKNLTNYILLPTFNHPETLPDHQLMKHGYSLENLINKVQELRPRDVEDRAVVVILDSSRNIRPPLVAQPKLTLHSLFPAKKKPNLTSEGSDGTLVCYVSEPGGQARRSRSGRHSIFVHHVIKEVFLPGRSVIKAIGTVNQLVIRDTKGDQKPYLEVDFPQFFFYPINKEKPRFRLFRSYSVDTDCTIYLAAKLDTRARVFPRLRSFIRNI